MGCEIGRAAEGEATDGEASNVCSHATKGAGEVTPPFGKIKAFNCRHTKGN